MSPVWLNLQMEEWTWEPYPVTTLGQFKFPDFWWSFKSKGKFDEHIEYMHSEHDETTPESVDSDPECNDEENKSNAEDNNSEIDENVSKSYTKNMFGKYTFCKTCNKNFAQNSNL